MGRVRELSHAVAADARGVAPLLGVPAARCERALGALEALPLARALLVRNRGRVVGYLELHARPEGTSGWAARISALALDPDDGPVRAGRMLVAAADAEAALLGCERILLEPGAASRDVAELGPAIGLERRPGGVGGRTVEYGRADSPVERFLRAAARGAADVLGVVGAASLDVPLDDPHGSRLDVAADDAMLAQLEPLGIPVLSEESGLTGQAPGDGYWISVDPLDGTRNCASRYAPWATSIGLLRGGRPVAGLVVDLATGRRWWAAASVGARVDGIVPRPRSGGLLVLPSTEAHRLPVLPEDVGFTRVRIAGATSIDLCRVADGSASAFLDLDRAIAQTHDVAAAMAVLEAVGATVLDEHGQPPRIEPDVDRHYRIVAAASESETTALLAAAFAARTR
jgi:3'(2'), 5'-bisphosphate nucleotidase